MATLHKFKIYLIILMLQATISLENYTNPTTDITCGRYDDCLIHCSNKLSCKGLYFVFENDWSVTDGKYNVTLLCDGIGACNNAQIFGNRTSSIHIDMNQTTDYYIYYNNNIDVHILFGSYHDSPQIAKVHCSPCQGSKFYYSSLQNNVSLIEPTDGIVMHECEMCIYSDGNKGNFISALNIYQLQLKCSGCDSDMTIYPPIHNNGNHSFLFQSTPYGIGANWHMFLYFLNGLFGKTFDCINSTKYAINQCYALTAGTLRIYCGPYFRILDNADNIFVGSYSSNCPSIYDEKITDKLSAAISLQNVLVFNAHRYNSHRQQYLDVYGDRLMNNKTAVIIMGDTYLPGETEPISILQLPPKSNVFLLCNGVGLGAWDGPCSGQQSAEITFNASYSTSLVVAGGRMEYINWYSGLVFHSFFLQNTRYNTFHLENADFVYMISLETDAGYDYLSSDVSIYLFFHLYIGEPSSFTLDCNHGYGCSESYLFAQTGSYLYIPADWNIKCFDNTYDPYQLPGCDPFQLTLGDGSRCQDVDPVFECTSWLKAPPTPSPSKPPSFSPTTLPTMPPTTHRPSLPPTYSQTAFPVTSAPTNKPSSHSYSQKSFVQQLLESSIYTIAAVGIIAGLLIFMAIFGLIHRENADKAFFMKCLKPSDDCRPFALIALALAVWDFLSDWNWAFSINSDEYKYYFYTSIAINIISWLLNLVYLFSLIRKFKQDSNLAIWLRKYVLFLTILAIISGKASNAISVCNCHLFGLSVFEMGLPLFRIQMEITRWKILFNTVLQNIPQIILQMLYISVRGSVDIATLFALLPSCFCVMLTISIFVIQAGIRWNSKTFNITVKISEEDALNPLLCKRRYQRRKTGKAISEATSIQQQRICVEKIYPPLIIRVSINQEYDELSGAIFDVLRGNRKELKQHIKSVFLLYIW